MSTLIGAIIGGLVSLGTTLLVERQRSKNLRASEDERLLDDALLAARVILLELKDIESVLRVSLDKSPYVWPPKLEFSFTTLAWDEYATQLGRKLDDENWNAIATPYSALSYVNLLGALPEDSARETLVGVQQAIAAIEAWAATPRTVTG